ncbi:uncharacterized protein LOC110873302 [Helianthus annuus]|uniref:uncharacterized protein LOC110873302 n=1 Tax=Helianthus annuus TaxID=4232 RepID=UPI000B8F3B9D|nr:uncharacterized protein LOC110873302 [Helianthus annuus]XP_035832617.1 uncharacterized protein LOC110873302 [Helianthus annuus]XP_035832618.1 uncharacterized protein LOC110873302 [Helianthus annuus]
MNEPGAKRLKFNRPVQSCSLSFILQPKIISLLMLVGGWSHGAKLFIQKLMVLAVLNLKTTTCYYLDSLRPSSINEQLRKIIDMVMVVFAARSGTSMRVKLNSVNARFMRERELAKELKFWIMTMLGKE